MSSRVGTAIPASRSTALSSAADGLTRSIQTAFSGSASSSVAAAFFSEDSEGTNTESMGNSDWERQINQQDLARFWQAFRDGRRPHRSQFAAARRQESGWIRQQSVPLPQNGSVRKGLRQKRHSLLPQCGTSI